MKAEQIQAAYLELMNELKKAPTDEVIVTGFIPVAALMLTEVAIQLAQVNEHLNKIANPPTENEESPWVQLCWRGRSFVVNRNEVTAVFQYGMSTMASVINLRGETGEDPGRYCETPLRELCAKLGIPFKEQP